jgi:hypothetical protein
MAYCGPRGVPFDTGWLSWSDLDRAAALAWLERDSDRCPGCGLHHADIHGERPDRLPVRGEYRYCPGCDAKALTVKPPDDKREVQHFAWAPRPAPVHPGPDGASVGDVRV